MLIVDTSIFKASLNIKQMLFSKETLKAYAQSKGITNIESDGLNVLGQDLEYRLKELFQEALKYMNASHRTWLSVSDINSALMARNVEPMYGYGSSNLMFCKSNAISNLFYVPDEEIDLEDYLSKEMPKIPQHPKIYSHWLAIEGVQPQIPENPILREEVQKQDTLHNYQEEVEIKPAVKHVLTKELQIYFDNILSFLASQTPENVKSLLECLEFDSGLQQLIPYFIQHFYDMMLTNSDNNILIQCYISLLRNKHLFFDPYLHQVIPALLTGVLGRNKEKETRVAASHGVKYIYENFAAYPTIPTRIVKTLRNTLLDENKLEDVHYGALFCLSTLGNHIIETVVHEDYKNYSNLFPTRSTVISLFDAILDPDLHRC